MMRFIARHRPSPSMAVALLALSVALGGTGYAAIKLPKNSVGSKQIKPNAVTGAKVKDASLFSNDFAPGQLPRGIQGPQGPQGLPGPKGDEGAPGTVPATEALKLAAPLIGGWSAWDAARSPTYYKDPFGGVRIAGGIKGGTWALSLAAGNIAFTLPAGYRPGHTHYQPVLVTSAANNGFEPIPGPYVGITADGAVHMIASPVTTNFFVSLDGITFRAEN
jgi:hypothetical protein